MLIFNGFKLRSPHPALEVVLTIVLDLYNGYLGKLVRPFRLPKGTSRPLIRLVLASNDASQYISSWFHFSREVEVFQTYR